MPFTDSRSLRAPSEGRVPPHDLDAESAVLSAMLLSNDAFDTVQELLEPQHFYAAAHRIVYEAVVALQERGTPVDIVSVAAFLRDRERLQQIGGTPFLARLSDATPAVAHVAAHARVVREKWRLRQLIGACQRFAAEGYGDCGEVQQFIDRAEQAVLDIGRTQDGTAVRPLRDAITKAFDGIMEAAKRGGDVTGVSTGFYDLDRKTSGLHPGDLYIVAGRPGMGKTAFVLSLAVNAARGRELASRSVTGSVEEPGWGVAFFSLEMPREQLANRLLAGEARLNLQRLRNGQLEKEHWNQLTEAASELGRLPLWIDDTPALTLLDLRAKVRRLKAELSRDPESRGLGLVVIDYLQLMEGRPDVQSREQAISELSRGLKQLSKDMGVPVIALSQLNRAVESRPGKDRKPQLSDLRESGAIEQDADAVMFVYRPWVYFKEDPSTRNQALVIIAKQRNGPTGEVSLRFDEDYARFENLARESNYSGDPYEDLDPT